jgi:predicted Ser/Thr protein kinase
LSGIRYTFQELSDNGISIVRRIKAFNGTDTYIYILKRSIPYLIENEVAFLNVMQSSGYVPRFDRYDKYTLRIEDLGQSEPVTNWSIFRDHCAKLLHALSSRSVRHGDITEQAVIIRNNKPYLIDFAESRWKYDSAPDKQGKTDETLMGELVHRLVARATTSA